MILEVAVLNVKSGRTQDFEKDFQIATQYISSIEGYLKHSLQKCIEFENQYLLLVEWTSVEAHEVGFRQSPQYQQWKALLHDYYNPFPQVLHYESI
ncbi:antibiotic biosynthesis monooxygenase family protein [Sphingobacterium tabacisoli]|uniref:Antibiotic biosynthesis monooxygenase family protein n=1 Tax=Sphingobacterium tabacisoli TaxID=2044855 RepID=A0ABW5L623_9SPHI|nr:antibiotic biosynthesis monooxygenase [Sphingobacterium tabacisoli]